MRRGKINPANFMQTVLRAIQKPSARNEFFPNKKPVTGLCIKIPVLFSL